MSGWQLAPTQTPPDRNAYAHELCGSVASAAAAAACSAKVPMRREKTAPQWPVADQHGGTPRHRAGPARNGVKWQGKESDASQPAHTIDREVNRNSATPRGKGLHCDAKGRAGQPRRATTPSGDRAQEPANPMPHASTVFKALKNSNSVTTYPEPTSLHSRRLSGLPT
jgi:hypothetical protein